MMWDGVFGMSWFMWALMAVGQVAFWTIILLAVRALWPDAPPSGTEGKVEPLLTLQERLARGEVSPEEFERRRRLLVDGR